MKQPETPDEIDAHAAWADNERVRADAQEDVRVQVSALQRAAFEDGRARLLAMQDALTYGAGWLRVDGRGRLSHVSALQVQDHGDDAPSWPGVDSGEH